MSDCGGALTYMLLYIFIYYLKYLTIGMYLYLKEN